MGYCVMTFEKIKTVTQMNRKFEHNYRIHPIDNADDNRKRQNFEIAPVNENGKQFYFRNNYKENPNNDFMDRFNEKINSTGYYKDGKKPRKDAVMGIELTMAFSREDRENIDVKKWAEDSVEWARKAFNRRPDLYGDNVISAVVHMDEGNPHLHVVVVPIDEKGALNAKAYTGGFQTCVDLQTSYADAMQPYNLQRGEKGSRASHKTVKKFYEALSHCGENQEFTVRQGETFQAYAERIAKEVEILKMQHLDEKLKWERKTDILKTEGRNTLINTRKEMHGVERERDNYKQQIDYIEEKHESVAKAVSKANVVDELQYSFDNYPDSEKREQIKKDVNKLTKYARDHKNKEKDIDITVYK